MKKMEVFGAAKLKGQIKISGSKNASLPILAATLLSDKKIFLKNLPKVKDIETMILLLIVNVFLLSSIVEPKDFNNSIIVSISFTLGRFVKDIFLYDNKVAAKIGRDAFLEPEILICPLSFAAPKTSNFFIIILLVKLLQFAPYIYPYGLHMKFLVPDLP